MNTNNNFSFQKGWGQVPQQDARNVKAKIMAALGIKTRATWLSRLRGKTEPRFSEHTAIETIFREHGITEVWGEQNKQL